MIDVTMRDDAAPAPRTNLQRAMSTLRSPATLAAVFRAQVALRRCDVVPWGVRLHGRALVVNRGRIELGERVRIDGSTVRVELVSMGGLLTIGEASFINYGASISAHEHVSIGRDCLIGNYAMIMDNDYHDPLDHNRVGASRPISIEDHAWIGARAIVLKGVRVGEGAVVAAGAVVTKDVPPRTLVAGVPAVAVRSL